MRHIKTTEAKNEIITNDDIKTRLRMRDCREILGCEELVIRQYLTDDFIIMRPDWKDYDNHKPNELASFYVKEPVYGPCLILSPEEVCLHEDWVHQSRRSLSGNRASDQLCEGKGTDTSGRKMGKR